MKTPSKRYYATAARVGAQLRRIRKEQGLTIATVAKKAGLVQQQVSEVELGHVNTPIETLARLASVLHVPLEDVVFDPMVKKELLKVPQGYRLVQEDMLARYTQQAHDALHELAQMGA